MKSMTTFQQAVFHRFSALVVLICVCLWAGTALGQQIDETNKYAWSENTGWQNFRTTHGEALVFDSHLEGYVWGENIGWIRLGTHTGGGTHTYTNNSHTTYGVNRTGNNLSGYAWSEASGWINFNPTHGGVTINPSTGDFSGYAWGENIGWIKLAGTALDSTLYKVQIALPTTFTVTGTAGTGGSISPASQTVAHGATTTFTVTPNTGYGIADVSGCGGTLSGNTYTTGAITGACTVSASFSQNTHTVTGTAGDGGSINPATRTVTHGQTTTFTVTPDAGYGIQAVTGCGGTLSGNTFTTGAITADCEVNATFEAFSAPTVTTQAVTSIGTTTATGNGTITALGTTNPTAHGVCWATTANPTTAGTCTDKGAASATGAFTASITGLTAGTTYHVRAFATNTAGTSYGENVTFTTSTPPGTHALTVTSGTGTGTYEAGAVVSIAANVPVEGKIFNKWTGDTARVHNVNNPNTTVTMPAQNIAVEATYKDVTQDDHTLTVNEGTGSGTYKEGAVANIAANPQEGKVFDQWTGTGVAHVANVNIPNTTVIMPGQNITVTANFKNRPAQNVTLTVNSGTGEGSYPAGRVVQVKADDPTANQIFDIWTGQTDRLTDVNSPDTTITMPDANVTITATYRDKSNEPFNLIVNHGTGDGAYLAGTNPEIKATIPGGQIFDKWTGQTGRVANVNLPDTSVTMPASEVTVTATFMETPGGTFTLEQRIYKEDQAQQAASMELSALRSASDFLSLETKNPGAWYTITATNEPGYDFFRWEGQTHNVENVNNQTTRIYMPAANVVLVAVYTPQQGPGPTPTAIPTMSEWGLIIMSVLMLITGAIMYRRREQGLM